MNRGSVGRHGRTSRRGLFARVATGALALAFATGLPRAGASPIMAYQQLVTEADLSPAWQTFLAGGPTLWAVEPPPVFPSGLTLTFNNAGRVVATPLSVYLEWRRAIDPLRFDANHPNIGPPLAQGLVPPVESKPTPRPPINPAPQVPGIPEPSTLPIGLVLAAAAVGWHRRRRLVRM